MKLYFVNRDSEVFDATEATSSVKWSGKKRKCEPICYSYNAE